MIDLHLNTEGFYYDNTLTYDINLAGITVSLKSIARSWSLTTEEILDKHIYYLKKMDS